LCGIECFFPKSVHPKSAFPKCRGDVTATAAVRGTCRLLCTAGAGRFAGKRAVVAGVGDGILTSSCERDLQQCATGVRVGDCADAAARGCLGPHARYVSASVPLTAMCPQVGPCTQGIWQDARPPQDSPRQSSRCFRRLQRCSHTHSASNAQPVTLDQSHAQRQQRSASHTQPAPHRASNAQPVTLSQHRTEPTTLSQSHSASTAQSQQRSASHTEPVTLSQSPSHVNGWLSVSG